MYDVFNGGGKGCGECGGDYGGDSDGVFVGGVFVSGGGQEKNLQNQYLLHHQYHPHKVNHQA